MPISVNGEVEWDNAYHTNAYHKTLFKNEINCAMMKAY